MKYKTIKFPEDEKPHNNFIEWWYYNGHLKDGEGNTYAFMNCLFKVDVKKVKIPFLIRNSLGDNNFFKFSIIKFKYI